MNTGCSRCGAMWSSDCTCKPESILPPYEGSPLHKRDLAKKAGLLLDEDDLHVLARYLILNPPTGSEVAHVMGCTKGEKEYVKRFNSLTKKLVGKARIWYEQENRRKGLLG